MTDDVWTEDLPRPRRRRSGRVLLVVLMLTAVSGIAVRLTRPGGSDTRAAPTPVATSSSGEPAPRNPSREFRPPPACPRATDGQAVCTTYRTVQPGVRRAVRALDPTLVIDSSVTQMLRPTGPEALHGLWSLEVTGHAGALQLRIAVTRRDTGNRAVPASAVTLAGSRVSAVASGDQGPYTVRVAVRGMNVRPAAALMDQLVRLATDRRLVRPAMAPRGTMVR